MAEGNLGPETDSGPIKPKRGGARPGAGRPPGRKDNKTLEIEAAARGYAGDALKALIFVAAKGKNESARIAAACALLDRGYGRPRQAVEHSGRIDGTGVLAIPLSAADEATWQAGVLQRQAMLGSTNGHS